jgi:hypothetical protein
MLTNTLVTPSYFEFSTYYFTHGRSEVVKIIIYIHMKNDYFNLRIFIIETFDIDQPFLQFIFYFCIM